MVASADWTDFTIALPTIINLVFMFAFGACAGSFIHVVADRMPAGLSVISPPSRCPGRPFHRMFLRSRSMTPSAMSTLSASYTRRRTLRSS